MGATGPLLLAGFVVLCLWLTLRDEPDAESARAGIVIALLLACPLLGLAALWLRAPLYLAAAVTTAWCGVFGGLWLLAVAAAPPDPGGPSAAVLLGLAVLLSSGAGPVWFLRRLRRLKD